MSDGEMVDLVVRGLTREEVYRWAGRDDSDEDYCVLLSLAARRQVAEWEREERDATSYTDGAESFRRHLRVASVDDPASVSIEVEMEEISGESHADIDVPWARLLPLLNRVRAHGGLPRLVEESGDGAQEAPDRTCDAESAQGNVCAREKGHVGCHEVYVDGDGRRWWGDARFPPFEPSPEAVEHVAQWLWAYESRPPGSSGLTWDRLAEATRQWRRRYARELLSGLPCVVSAEEEDEQAEDACRRRLRRRKLDAADEDSQ
jgi:hypothetical protein